MSKNLVRSMLLPQVEMKREMFEKQSLKTELKYLGIDDLVLQFGRSYKWAKCAYKMGTPKECFNNSAKLALSSDLIYVEGFAAGPKIPLPIHHSWCIQPGKNKVIDTTSTLFRHYYGIPFTKKYLWKHWSNPKNYSSLLDDWENGFPLLKMNLDEIKKIIYED